MKEFKLYHLVAAVCVTGLAAVAFHSYLPSEAIGHVPTAGEQNAAGDKNSAAVANTNRAIGMLEPITDEDRKAADALVKKISQEKAVVTDLFRGPGGFLGVVINPGENKFIGWMPPTRDVLVVGAMFDQSGKNVTQTEMLARGYAKPQPDAQASAGAGAQPTPASLQQAVDRTAGFVEGTGGPIVTAFVDYNCTYCKEFYVRSRAFVAQGQMRVRWVPVAILADNSLQKAASVLSNPDPIGAMALAEEGRLVPVSTVSPAMQEKIGANSAVLNMISGGNSATPTLMLRRANGTFNVSMALPQDLRAFLADR